MDGSHISVPELSHIVQHWSFIVTLIVLILAGVVMENMGRDPGPSANVLKQLKAFLLASACWGVYFVVHTIIFLCKFWLALFTNAGSVVVFMTLIALVSGFWLTAVGISLVITFFSAEGASSQHPARIKRAEWVTISLAAAWFVCCCIVFTSMYAYLYLSTLGLLLLGFYGTSEAIRKFLKGQKQETHVLIRIVGALSASLGLFAFIGVFYRFSFGESWSIVIRQFLVAVSFGGVGVLLLCRRCRVVQLVLSLMAICVVVWRVSDCVYKVPELSRSIYLSIRSARELGCGRYDRMAYHEINGKPMDLVESSSYGCGVPNCESIPIDFQVRREGVVLNDGPVSPEGDLSLKLASEFIDGLRWGASLGLLLAVERNVPWKTVVSLVEKARQNGNHRILFLFRRPVSSLYDSLPEHRLKPWVEEIFHREDVHPAEKRIYCIKKLYTIDTYCPQIQRELSGERYADLFEWMEIIGQVLPEAALGCIGDVDLDALDLLFRCMHRFESLCVARVPISGPDEPWAKEVALPADMPWEIAYKHVLKAIALEPYQRQPPPPLRLLVGEQSADGKEK